MGELYGCSVSWESIIFSLPCSIIIICFIYVLYILNLYVQTTTTLKQFKDMRSLCLKIVSSVINKYEDHKFGSDFWDIFFASVKPLIDRFKQEAASSEKPSSLLSCFVAMSRNYKLVALLCREESLVPDIYSILCAKSASEAVIFCVLKFVENLLSLDNELDDEDNPARSVLHSNIVGLVESLCCLFGNDTAAKRYELILMMCLYRVF